MIAYFWPFDIMKSLKQNNEVAEMDMVHSLNTTGQTAVYSKDRAPGFEFVKFESLDAPLDMPAGSVVFIGSTVLHAEGFVISSVVLRGW